MLKYAIVQKIFMLDERYDEQIHVSLLF